MVNGRQVAELEYNVKKSGLFKLFATDSQVEKDGVWVPVGKDGDKEIRFRLARAGGGNTRYLKLLELKTKPLRRQIQNDLIDIKTSDELMMEVFAETVVVDWENVFEDGVAVPYSKEKCLEYFKALPDLFNDVREQASKAAYYRSEVMEKEAGN